MYRRKTKAIIRAQPHSSTPHERIKTLATYRRPRVNPRLEKAFKAIEETLGGREALVSILQNAPQTPEMDFLIGAVLDPTNDLRSLGGLCRDAGIPIGQLMKLLSDANIAKAQIESMHHISKHLPGVVSNVMEQSLPQEILCPWCKNDNVQVMSCKLCNGTGKTIKQPELETQKVALELGGMLKKGGGVQINQQINTNVGGFSSSELSKIRDATDKILFQPQNPTQKQPVDVDAEVIPNEN